MQINEEDFRYWCMFGYKLGRMEFIWDRSIPETQREYDNALNELLFMIGGEFNPAQGSYKEFSSQILIFYQRKNIYIYSFILIGICLQRCQLSSSVPESYRAEFRESAKSALSGIPKTIVPDKELLFSTIERCEYDAFPDACCMIIEVINRMYDPESTDDKISHQLHDANKYVFISYSTKDQDYVNIIKKTFEDNNIRFWIAPDSIPAGSEYTEVIVDAIENSTIIVLVLSDNSQGSVWVPKELDLALSNEKPIIPIHIDKSELNKKMRFRLSNLQIEEANENFEKKLSKIVSVIANIMKS